MMSTQKDDIDSEEFIDYWFNLPVQIDMYSTRHHVQIDDDLGWFFQKISLLCSHFGSKYFEIYFLGSRAEAKNNCVKFFDDSDGIMLTKKEFSKFVRVVKNEFERHLEMLEGMKKTYASLGFHSFDEGQLRHIRKTYIRQCTHKRD